MPVFLSTRNAGFPSVHAASREGLLAVGGDLSRERLLAAYARGIFPWYDAETPILWWTPPKRCMLRPEDVHIPRSLRRIINSRRFQISLDADFAAVIRSCAAGPRPGQSGTWLVAEMVAAYTDLHNAGYAHSVEARQDGQLVGGLYGVARGGAFFGESMFFRTPDASKVCFIWLAGLLRHWGFSLIDCQQVTANLLRFGAYTVPRAAFAKLLAAAMERPDLPGPWRMPDGFFPL